MQGFARHLGVRHTLVYSDFYSVIRDLLGKEVVRDGDRVTLAGNFPVTGDVIATGFTVLPWRQAVLLYSEPTFPSQVLLVAPARSPLEPIKEGRDLADEIQQTKSLIGREKPSGDEANLSRPGQLRSGGNRHRSQGLHEKRESQRDGPGAPQQRSGIDAARRARRNSRPQQVGGPHQDPRAHFRASGSRSGLSEGCAAPARRLQRLPPPDPGRRHLRQARRQVFFRHPPLPSRSSSRASTEYAACRPIEAWSSTGP